MSGTRATVTLGPEAIVAINRYWDPLHDAPAAKILPGQFYVGAPGEMIVTVLGSCVAACIRDVATGIGGMNHFMLPDGEASRTDLYGAAERYGQFAMESLINAILGAGGRRERLEVKLAGGGHVLKGGIRIGAHNIAFAHRYLATDGLTVAAEDVGGDCARKVYYFPDTGRLRVRHLRSLKNDTIEVRESAYGDLLSAVAAGSVELFQP